MRLLKNILSIILLPVFCNTGFAQIEKLVIDKKIEAQSKKYFGPPASSILAQDSFYENTVYFRTFVEDSLTLDFMTNPYIFSFSCHHFYKNDTLFIEGTMGTFVLEGFYAKIFKDSILEMKHLRFWGKPSYYLTASQAQPQSLIKVDVNSGKLILNTIPPNNSKKTIFGYIEFKSKDFYVEVSDKQKTKIPLKATWRQDGRIYFKSRYFQD